MNSSQRTIAEKLIKEWGLLDREGIPPFEDFVNKWVPAEFLNILMAIDGGRQGAGMTATVEIFYSIFVAMKAGSPTFQVQPDLIIALRDTEIPTLPIDMMRTPFEGFFIVVPKGTFAPPVHTIQQLYISNVEGDRFRVAFDHGENSHYINFLTDCPEETIYDAMSRSLGAQADMPEHLLHEIREESVYEDYYKADVLRFAVNLALYITCPDADMYQDQSKQRELHQRLQGVKGGRRRNVLLDKIRKEKERKIFIVGANTRLQKEYTAELTESGKRWVLKQRVRIRGYWRQQPYGPKLSLRRPQFIAPHHRGPDYAEMVRRGYVVGPKGKED